jgi:hypothetical protein
MAEKYTGRVIETTGFTTVEAASDLLIVDETTGRDEKTLWAMAQAARLEVGQRLEIERYADATVAMPENWPGVVLPTGPQGPQGPQGEPGAGGGSGLGAGYRELATAENLTAADHMVWAKNASPYTLPKLADVSVGHVVIVRADNGGQRFVRTWNATNGAGYEGGTDTMLSLGNNNPAAATSAINANQCKRWVSCGVFWLEF